LSQARQFLRKAVLTSELLLHLKREKYDLVWTQWPEMDAYSRSLWAWARLIGIRLVHTVHNVVPHEETPEDIRRYGEVYEAARFLLVHSDQAAKELRDHFPKANGKIMKSLHGMYSAYPRRPEVRDETRRRLDLMPDDKVVLFCGGIRPYKNIDSVLHAFTSPELSGFRLVISGKESGYPDLDGGDPLGRTRRITEELSITSQVRFMPGFLSNEEMSTLLEAADIFVLPYLKSYGSGQLLLGITFGKYIVATNTGGAAEYLAYYSKGTLLKDSSSGSICQGLLIAGNSASLYDPAEYSSALHWKEIAGRALAALQDRL
jgi:glycosyltransferase involved in cell wall biosynthesis